MAYASAGSSGGAALRGRVRRIPAQYRSPANRIETLSGSTAIPPPERRDHPPQFRSAP